MSGTRLMNNVSQFVKLHRILLGNSSITDTPNLIFLKLKGKYLGACRFQKEFEYRYGPSDNEILQAKSGHLIGIQYESVKNKH